MLLNVLAMLLAYGLGSISSAILLAKLTNQPDPRTQGSGNPGATNMLRYAGKSIAALTLGLDILKGFIAVLIGRWFGVDDMALAMVGVAACIGHMFPVFFGFQGGKGVATAAGMLLALSWPLAAACAVIWLLVAGLFRYSSLASLTAFCSSPLLSAWLASPTYIPPLLLLAVLLAYRHQSNIQRLLTGKENKIVLKR